MDRKVAPPDAVIARIAERQHGVVSASQLHDLGFGEGAIRLRLNASRLHRVHRGVYAVGHSALAPEGRCFAAVLAVGQGSFGGGDSSGGDRSTSAGGLTVLDHWGAAVSHRSATCLWDLLPASDGPVDVIAGGRGGKAKRRGIRIHRSRSLLPSHVTLRHGIPVTTPARTVSDLRLATSLGRSGAVSPRELRKAIRQANVLDLPVDEESARDRTRSDLEGDFLKLYRRHGLPPPEVNVPIGRYLVDFLWRERRLVVETDSYLYHRGKVAFQDDRDRDLELKRLGYEVLRLSERQIDEEPQKVAQVLSAAMRAGPD